MIADVPRNAECAERQANKRACEAPSRDGVMASFLIGHLSKMCTGARK
jgi:hypothetical protein